MLAVKHLDPLIGLDIHLIVTPPGAVVPIPHPHVGFVFDPFDYLPVLGATVLVNGLPRAHAGTGGVEMPKHFPIGGSFLKPPSNSNETFMGSATVVADEEPFTFMTLPVLSCQDIGMPPPGRKRASSVKSLVLPTTMALSIPASAPVFVGGSPIVSLSGLLTQAAFAGLAKGLKKLGKLRKASRRMRALSKRLHNAADKLLDKLKVSKRSRDRIHKALCTLTGHPVDVATGRVLTEAVDWEIPGPLPLKFERNYTSSCGERDSVLGHGWSHSLDLALWTEPGQVVFRAEDGREIEFDTSDLSNQQLLSGDTLYHPVDRLTLRRRDESRWEVETKTGVVHELAHLPSETQPGLYRVIRTRNRTGQEISYEYDASGRLDWIQDSVGRRILFEHDARGHLSRVALPHPRKEGWVTHNRYTYSEAGDLIAVEDALGNTSRYAYRSHLLVRETDRMGLSFYFEYDSETPAGWCTHTWGDGGIYDHRLIYDKVQHLTAVTNSLGHTTTYLYDEAGVVIRKVDPLGNEWQYEFDDALRATAEIDPLGNTSRSTYDARGNLVEIIAPDGSTLKFEYNHLDLPERAVDAIGGEWLWRYDAAGQLEEEVNPLGERHRYEYSEGRLTACIGPDSERTTFSYDDHGNIVRVIQPTGAVLRFRYDHLGRRTHSQDPNGGEYHVRHDLLGREIRTENAAKERWEQRYDAEGNLLDSQGPLRKLRFGYSGLHQLAFRAEAGTQVNLRYDTEQNLVGITNEAGEHYHFDLDATGRLWREESIDGSRYEYEYDAAGRQIRTRYPSGRSETFTYDAMSRLVELLRSDGTFSRFKYRPDGALIEAENETGKVTFSRDALGNVLRETHGDIELRSQFSPGGKRVALESSLAMRQSFKRDALGRVTELSWRCGDRIHSSVVGFERDPAGLERSRHHPGRVTVSWRHDAVGRPVERSTSNGVDRHLLRTYLWRADTQLAMLKAGTAGNIEYTHDDRGRLIAAVLPNGRIQHRNLDAAGNVYRPSARGDTRYGRGGRIQEAEGCQFAHDADGNLIQKREPGGGIWHYQWNNAGLLSELERPDGLRVRFTYDAFARRTAKVTYRLGPQGQELIERTVRFVWDGQVLLHELDSATGTTTWLFEPDEFAPLAKEDQTGRYAVVTDHLGTPTEMYDELGRLAWRMQMDLVGLAQADVSLQKCPWRWPGQYADEESGLHYNRFRYYDPHCGQYISADPLRAAGGLAPYAYTADPLAYSDPWGLSSCKASKLEVIEPHTKQWTDAVKAIREGGGKGINFRVRNQRLARQLLEEARPGIPKRRSYVGPRFAEKHGFEYHLKNEVIGAPSNDLRHLKWYDWRPRSSANGNGHVFFNDWI